MAKGFLYAESEVLDAPGFEKYREKVGAVSASFGGRYVARRAEPAVLDGEWSPKRLVIIEFDSPQQVRTFYDSPEYQGIPPHRLRSTKGHVLLLTGADVPAPRPRFVVSGMPEMTKRTPPCNV
jgi:uncharacterized protein (DUF1330 family)